MNCFNFRLMIVVLATTVVFKLDQCLAIDALTCFRVLTSIVGEKGPRPQTTDSDNDHPSGASQGASPTQTGSPLPIKNKVELRKLTKPPMFYTLKSNAAQMAIGIPLDIDLFALETHSPVIFADGSRGEVIGKGEINNGGQVERTVTVRDSRSQSHNLLEKGLRALVHEFDFYVTSGEKTYKIRIWDGTGKFDRGDLSDLKTIQQALAQADHVLLLLLQHLTLNPFANKRDGEFRKRYRDFTWSAASAGMKNERTKLDEINFFFELSSAGPEILLELLNHESGHSLASWSFGSPHPNSQWIQSKEKDGNEVSDYGSNSPGEDFAESFRLYRKDPIKFSSLHPHRTRLLKQVIRDFLAARGN